MKRPQPKTLNRSAKARYVVLSVIPWSNLSLVKIVLSSVLGCGMIVDNDFEAVENTI